MRLAVSKEYKCHREDEDKVVRIPLTPTAIMEYRLKAKEGKKLCRKRSITVEPVFGHIKEIFGFGCFIRRGLKACICEWKLICTVHNILKIWRNGFDKVRNKTSGAKAIFFGTGQDRDKEVIVL